MCQRYSNTAAKSNTVKKTVTQMIPLQLVFHRLYETGNPVNLIYNPTRKDDPVGKADVLLRNTLYMVASPGDQKYHASLHVEVPTTYTGKLFWFVLDKDNSEIARGELSDGRADLVFSHASKDGVDRFFIRVGVLLNKATKYIDLVLNEADAAAARTAIQRASRDDRPVYQNVWPKIRPVVCGTSAAEYEAKKGRIKELITVGGNNIYSPVSNAISLLKTFVQGAAPTQIQGNDASFNCFAGSYSEWLTHNAGAGFSQGGAGTKTDGNSHGGATIKRYSWGSDTSVGKMVAGAPQLHDAIERHYDSSTVQAEVDWFVENNSRGAEATLPSLNTFYTVPHGSLSPAWVPGKTVLFDRPWVWDVMDDLNGTIGRGRLLKHQVQYRIRRTFFGAELVSVTHLGMVEDLYDFHFEAGGLARLGATLQIGHGRGTYGTKRIGGQIFLVRVHFYETYTP